MTCEDVPSVIDAYLDDELSVTAILEAHEHFAVCDNCRRVLESEAALHGLIVQAARAEAVPTTLRRHILGNLRTTEPARSRPTRRLAMRFGIVSGFVGLAVLGWLGTERITPHPLTPLAAELTSKHLLYGEGRGGALELVTSEPAKMGTWFQGRLGFPVRLPSGARRPERLVGGRVLPERSGYYLGHRMTEALVGERGLPEAVRAPAADFQAAEDVARGIQTA